MRIYFLLFLTIFSYTKVRSQPLKDGDITWNFVGKSGGFKVMGYNNILPELIEKRQRPLPDSFVINYHTSLKDDSIKDLSITKYLYEKTFEVNKHLDITLYFKKNMNCYTRELRYFDPNTVNDYLVREHYFYRKNVPAKFGINYLNENLVDSVLVEIYESSRITNCNNNFEVKMINFFYTNLDPSPKGHYFEYNEKGDSFYKDPFLNYPIVVSSIRMSTFNIRDDIRDKYGIFNKDTRVREISKDSTFSLLKYLINEKGFQDEIYNYYLSENTPGIGDRRIYLNDPFHAWPNFETASETEIHVARNCLPNSRSIFSVTYPKYYKGFGPTYKVTSSFLSENEIYITPKLYQSKKISEYSKGSGKLCRIDNSFSCEGLDIKKAKNKQLSTFTYLNKDTVIENLTIIDSGKKYKYKIIYKISY